MEKESFKRYTATVNDLQVRFIVYLNEFPDNRYSLDSFQIFTGAAVKSVECFWRIKGRTGRQYLLLSNLKNVREV